MATHKLHVVTRQESRNRYTGLPEMAFYRPPDPVNVKAAKNFFKAMAIGLLLASPLWIEFIREWRAQ